MNDRMTYLEQMFKYELTCYHTYDFRAVLLIQNFFLTSKEGDLTNTVIGATMWNKDHFLISKEQMQKK